MSCNTTLKRRGMKLTPQRRLIIDVLAKHKSHLTAEEIINRVQAEMPGVNKSTIYRTLELLERAGCVLRSKAGGRFIYHHAEEGRHHHLVCRNCGRNIECAEDLFFPVEQEIEQRYGFRVDLKHLVLRGLCAACRNTQ